MFKLLLLEKYVYLGGKINICEVGEFIMEIGVDFIVVWKENVMFLLEELYLINDLVYNKMGKLFIYFVNELFLIFEDIMFGILISVEFFFKSELIFLKVKIIVLKDLIIKNIMFMKDSLIGFFLKYFLGEELVEK